MKRVSSGRPLKIYWKGYRLIRSDPHGFSGADRPADEAGGIAFGAGPTDGIA